ncbi:MAG: hypothetical protein ACLSE4_16710 [Clostridium sp.]
MLGDTAEQAHLGLAASPTEKDVDVVCSNIQQCIIKEHMKIFFILTVEQVRDKNESASVLQYPGQNQAGTVHSHHRSSGRVAFRHLPGTALPAQALLASLRKGTCLLRNL